jgi:hypothetical protein
MPKTAAVCNALATMNPCAICINTTAEGGSAGRSALTGDLPRHGRGSFNNRSERPQNARSEAAMPSKGLQNAAYPVVAAAATAGEAFRRWPKSGANQCRRLKLHAKSGRDDRFPTVPRSTVTEGNGTPGLAAAYPRADQ